MFTGDSRNTPNKLVSARVSDQVTRNGKWHERTKQRLIYDYSSLVLETSRGIFGNT